MNSALTYDILGNAIIRGGAIQNSSVSLNATAFSISGSGQMVGYRFVLPENITASGFDVYWMSTGNPTASFFKGHIETDANDTASGVFVGQSSSAANIAVGNSWQGYQAFAASASLTANTPYWLVLESTGSPVLNTTNYVNLAAFAGNNGRVSGGEIKKFSSSAWLPSIQYTDANIVIRDSLGRYWGSGWNSAAADSEQIYGTFRYGIKYRMPGGVRIGGAMAWFRSKYGTYWPIEAQFYSGGTLQGTVTLPTASLNTTRQCYFYLTSSYTTVSGSDNYIILHQTNDSGSNNNGWALYRWAGLPAYMDTLRYPGWEWGTSSMANPTGSWSSSTNYIGAIFPVVKDPMSDFVGSGTSVEPATSFFS